MRLRLQASAGSMAGAGASMARPQFASRGLAPSTSSRPARVSRRRSDASRALAALPDREADIVIVGAGVAGLSAALTLHRLVRHHMGPFVSPLMLPTVDTGVLPAAAHS